jgi:sulfate adenylyltransferase subunit 2
MKIRHVQKKEFFRSGMSLDNGTLRRNDRELWSLFNARISKGENMRVFPISNWTELDIWQYIEREALALPFHLFCSRVVKWFEKGILLVPVTPLTPKSSEDISEFISVSFRTVGDVSCTCPSF